MSTATDEWWPKEPTGDEAGITVPLMNWALIPVSREHGYCLCIHPMMSLINFSGTSCKWCGQPVTDDAMGPGAKTIRTEAVKAAFPQFVKDPEQ